MIFNIKQYILILVHSINSKNYKRIIIPLQTKKGLGWESGLGLGLWLVIYPLMGKEQLLANFLSCLTKWF